jgi:ribosomal protein L44E
MSDFFKEKMNYCPICGRKDYLSIHKCSPTFLKNMERGKKAAEKRLENYGSMKPVLCFGKQLDDGFKLMNVAYE